MYLEYLHIYYFARNYVERKGGSFSLIRNKINVAEPYNLPTTHYSFVH